MVTSKRNADTKHLNHKPREATSSPLRGAGLRAGRADGSQAIQALDIPTEYLAIRRRMQAGIQGDANGNSGQEHREGERCERKEGAEATDFDGMDFQHTAHQRTDGDLPPDTAAFSSRRKTEAGRAKTLQETAFGTITMIVSELSP